LHALDPLTWLPNRSLFEARLASAVRCAHRPRSVLALLLVDLDRLAETNEMLGRACGDRVLREAAARLARALDGGAMLSRLQSDDFAAFLEVADLAAAAKRAAALLKSCREPYVIDCLAVTVTASIGIALCSSPAEDPASLLARAERALFQAKIRGRDCFYPGAATCSDGIDPQLRSPVEKYCVYKPRLPNIR
jgi:diguanylate cyclase (GGDEF)-like protein